MQLKLQRHLLIGFIVLSVGLVMGAVVGVQWYRLDLFPVPQISDWIHPPEERVFLSKKMVITTYTAMTPVFSDRQYFDSIGDERLEGLFLVQIPRHYSDNITIKAYKPTTIYRFISEDNINTDFDSWTLTDISINVRGYSTTHTRVVKRDFPAGVITLNPGGPIASSPVLIKVHNYTMPSFEFEVLNQTEFIYRK